MQAQWVGEGSLALVSAALLTGAEDGEDRITCPSLSAGRQLGVEEEVLRK